MLPILCLECFFLHSCTSSVGHSILLKKQKDIKMQKKNHLKTFSLSVMSVYLEIYGVEISGGDDK